MKITKADLTNLFANIVNSNLSLRRYPYDSEGYSSMFKVENLLKYWMKEYVYSGSSGGSCWGTSATPFHNSSEEIIDDISGDIEYTLRQTVELFAELAKMRNHRQAPDDALSTFSQAIAREMTDCYEDGRSENEYYGNGTDYHIGMCEFSIIFDLIKKHWTLEEGISFEDVMLAVQLAVEKEILEYTNAELKKEIKKHADLIASINSRKAAEKKNLEASIETYRRNIESCEKALEGIDKKYTKELKTLQAKYAELTQANSQ